MDGVTSILRDSHEVKSFTQLTSKVSGFLPFRFGSKRARAFPYRQTAEQEQSIQALLFESPPRFLVDRPIRASCVSCVYSAFMLLNISLSDGRDKIDVEIV